MEIVKEELRKQMKERTKAKTWDGEPWIWAEHKYDGIRLTFVKDSAGELHAFGRRWNVDLWEDVKFALDSESRNAALTLPRNSIVDGELYSEIEPASEVLSLVKRRVRQSLTYAAFAVPIFSGDAEYWRKDILDIRLILEEYGFRIAFCAAFPVMPSMDREELLSYVALHNIEGLVLKCAHYSGWYKLRPYQTADCVVIGVMPGVSKYSGMIGSLIVGQFCGPGLVLKEMANVGSGLTDEDRSLRPEGLIGRVCEIRFDGKLANGGLRFPRFVRWRDDKPAEECVGE